MSDRSDMDALLGAYADGELDAATAAAVEAWVEANPAAQRVLAVHRETRALLRTAFDESRYAGNVRIPEILKIPAQDPPVPAEPIPLPVGRPSASRRTGWGGPKWGFPRAVPAAWAAAACLAMALVGYAAGVAWPDALRSDRDRMLSEVAEYHAVYSRETVHLVEVPAAQSDHLKAWLGKRVNMALVIPDFREAGLTFAGGRLVVLDGEPVAELMYTREHGLPIAFCVLARSGKPTPVAVERRGTTNLATWDDGTHSYIVVGEADPAVIQSLAATAKKQL